MCVCNSTYLQFTNWTTVPHACCTMQFALCTGTPTQPNINVGLQYYIIARGSIYIARSKPMSSELPFYWGGGGGGRGEPSLLEYWVGDCPPCPPSAAAPVYVHLSTIMKWTLHCDRVVLFRMCLFDGMVHFPILFSRKYIHLDHTSPKCCNLIGYLVVHDFNSNLQLTPKHIDTLQF